MPNIFDAAERILTHTGPVTVQRLQRLCYYAQAWSLVWDEDELFPEYFEAWAGGPVCPELFNGIPVSGTVSAEDIPNSALSGVPLTAEQGETISAVVRDYSDMSDDELSELAKMADPWKRARRGIPPGMRCSSRISEKSMSAYYRYVAETGDARERYRRALED